MASYSKPFHFIIHFKCWRRSPLVVTLVSVCIYPGQAGHRCSKDCECPALPQFCSLKWGAVGWVAWQQLFQPLMTLMFLTSVSNVTHIMWLLCSYLVSVKLWGTGCGNWSVLLACHCSCCAGVKLMYVCTLVSCCTYVEGPELAFCSCYPLDTFTGPCKIPMWCFPSCCLEASDMEVSVLQLSFSWAGYMFGHEFCCHFSCSAEPLFSYLCVPRANATFSVYSLFQCCF